MSIGIGLAVFEQVTGVNTICAWGMVYTGIPARPGTQEITS
jgi:hypothetical protein